MPSNKVYAIVADCEPPMVKFGISIDPEKRLNSLQTGSPVRLVIAATIKGSRAVEKKIHNSLRHLRKHGEWFSLEYEAIEVVEIMESGNFGRLKHRLDEIAHQLYLDSIESTPDYPDKKYWGDREFIGTNEHLFGKLFSSMGIKPTE